MVVEEYGDNHSHTLRAYTDTADVVRRHGHVYLYDTTTGELIAEVAAEVADIIRSHIPTPLLFDGQIIKKG